MITDSFGFTHPQMADEPTLLGALHIAECGPCQESFGPDLALKCAQLAEAFEQEQRDRAKVRK